MHYTDITYVSGFTERVYYNMTVAEEAERFKRTNCVKSFPSANHRADTRSSKRKDKSDHMEGLE